MARRPALTKTELRLIAQELDTSHGLLLQLVQTKPWLTDISRQYLCGRMGLCNEFPVFRTVALMELCVPPGETVSSHVQAQVEASSVLRPEHVVSTSLNPWTVLTIALQQADKIYWTSGMFSGGMIRTKPVIVRYEITLDRVVLFVPALISYIRSVYPPEELEKTRYRNRWGELRHVRHVFSVVEQQEENEVIADVTGLSPADVFETNGDVSLISLCRDMLRPNFDPVEYMKRRGEWGYRCGPPVPREDGTYTTPKCPPGPTEEQVRRVKWMGELLAYVRKFFDTPWSRGRAT